MKKIIQFIFIFFISAGLIRPVFADSLLNNLKGRILLQTEKNGEAWYINPLDSYRYYLGRPGDAFNLMREQGIGITNINLKKIPVGILKINGDDQDNDGLRDNLELALGTNFLSADSDQDGFNDKEEIQKGFNPLGKGKIIIDLDFAEKYKGRIFLQVENKGEAWYVNPLNLHRYYLGRPEDAFAVMRYFGLGISNANLEKIPAKTNAIDLSSFEKKLFDLVNLEREKRGLEKLSLNKEIAEVAREHSLNLALEDKDLSGKEKSCDFPIIHHEGLIFGLYGADRLHNRNINYFSMSGENIALMSDALYSVSYKSNDPIRFEIENCESTRNELDKSFKESLEKLKTEEEKKNFIQTELEKRRELYEKRGKVNIINLHWKNEDDLAQETVEGWMNSPGHRENILNENFNEAGMGTAFVNGYAISTEIFIKRVNCGYTGAMCCQEEKYFYCYNPNECQKGICK